jgi:dipeptidyl aminopeptidase/acylaminoacyl peptidase
LRAAGCPVEYVVYADEGHGFTKKENAQDAQERVLAFLTKHLLESGS